MSMPIVIERMANGYIVRPLLSAKETSDQSSCYVFQDKGIASAVRDYQDVRQTLFGWLDEYFKG